MKELHSSTADLKVKDVTFGSDGATNKWSFKPLKEAKVFLTVYHQKRQQLSH